MPNTIEIKLSAEELLKRTIETYRFDVQGIYSPLLDGLDQGQDVWKVYSGLQPDLLSTVMSYGGSDCFGLARELMESLRNSGSEGWGYLPFDTKGLPSDAEAITGNVGHVALYKETREGIEILDPGFALADPIKVDGETGIACHQSGDGRSHTIEVNFGERKGQIYIKSGYHPDKEIGFSLDPLEESGLGSHQTRYMQIRPTLSNDKFDRRGKKVCGIKVKLMDNSVVFWDGNSTHKLSFDMVLRKGFKELNDFATRMNISENDLKSYLERYIRRSGQIRQLWPVSMRMTYYQQHNLVLQEGYRSWNSIRELGCEGGGAVAIIVDGQGNMLLYRVPQSREKQHIGRFAGQLNTMVETANDNENGLDNLSRGINEELGMSIDDFEIVNGAYREARYGLDGKTMARCYVIKPKKVLDLDRVGFGNSQEGGAWQWYPVQKALGLELERNVRPIVDLYYNQGLLT